MCNWSTYNPVVSKNNKVIIKSETKPVIENPKHIIIGDSQTPYGTVRVSHVCLNDNVVEGLECVDVPAFSVQYHPEAAAGPHDSAYLFDRFVELMEGKR
jgi:carbamoylphosphate synthase small subunit